MLDPIRVAFGFGRRYANASLLRYYNSHLNHFRALRICPGRHFAVTGLYITIASVLAYFDIEVPVDSEGKQVPLDFKMSPGVLS